MKGNEKIIEHLNARLAEEVETQAAHKRILNQQFETTRPNEAWVRIGSQGLSFTVFSQPERIIHK